MTWARAKPEGTVTPKGEGNKGKGKGKMSDLEGQDEGDHNEQHDENVCETTLLSSVGEITVLDENIAMQRCHEMFEREDDGDIKITDADIPPRQHWKGSVGCELAQGLASSGKRRLRYDAESRSSTPPWRSPTPVQCSGSDGSGAEDDVLDNAEQGSGSDGSKRVGKLEVREVPFESVDAVVRERLDSRSSMTAGGPAKKENENSEG